MGRIYLSVLLLLPALAMASGLEQLQEFLKNTKTASGSFEQKVLDKNGKVIDQDSKGEFLFSRPGHFVWEYTAPYYQSMVSDGKTLWVWDKDMNQVTVRTVKGALPSSPASVLFGTAELSKEWVTENLPDADGLEWVKLLPKHKDGNFEEVSIGMKYNKPCILSFKGSLGEISTLKFSNIKTGIKAPSNTFTFEIPKGADVLNVD